MATDEIYGKLNKIFRDVFDDDEIVLTAETTADDIEDWDSLAQITLITVIEDEFGIRFAASEISSLQNVGEMVEVIAKKQ
ncbi:acyl carrier protein [Adlercreutzia murintestinalis]|jgi:Acyl carrier protein|uniref:acyl carrier protein n=1 Tax=Adlercreutzia murintestinalis TaxID=2941325 RepID=UPI00203B309C|nr:acyl carrier protein [Adlercreutzia murintestinalis]